jgi:hypothetical protein
MSSAPLEAMTPPGNSDWDLVDQASLESFPASDPPARGSFHAAPSETTVKPPEVDAMCATRSRSRLALGVLAGGAAVAGLLLLGAKLRRYYC